MIYEHFRGDALEIECEIRNDFGVAIDVVAEGVSTRSQVRIQGWKDGDPPVANMDVEVDPQQPTKIMLRALDTSEWPIGMLVINAKHEKGGKPFSSGILQIKCVRVPTE